MTFPRTLLAFLLIGSLAVLLGCKHEGPEPYDRELLRLAEENGVRQWYGNSPELLPRSSGSGHPEPFLRTRYNDVAMNDVDDDGQVEDDAVFDPGALIVKELYDSPTHLYRYAIMYKKPGDPNADAEGWVWCEVRPGGEATTPSSDRGTACRGCHGGEGNIDRTLMNEAFPF